MTSRPKNIRQALAQQIDQKQNDINLAESLGKGNTSEARAMRFQAQEWQKVLDGTANDDEENN